MAFGVIRNATVPSFDGTTYTVELLDESGGSNVALDSDNPNKRLADDPIQIRRDQLFGRDELFGVHSVSVQLRLHGETTLLNTIKSAGERQYKLRIRDGATHLHNLWVVPSKCVRALGTDPLAEAIIHAECGILQLKGLEWTAATSRDTVLQEIVDILDTIGLTANYKTSCNWYPGGVSAVATDDPLFNIEFDPDALKSRLRDDSAAGQIKALGKGSDVPVPPPVSQGLQTSPDRPLYAFDVLAELARHFQLHIYQGSTNAWRIEQRHEKRQPDSGQQYFWNYSLLPDPDGLTESSKGLETAAKTYDEQNGNFSQRDVPPIETGITSANAVYTNYRHGSLTQQLIPSKFFTLWDDASTPNGWTDIGTPTVSRGKMPDGGQAAVISTVLTPPGSVDDGIETTTFDFSPDAADTVAFYFTCFVRPDDTEYIKTQVKDNLPYPQIARVRANRAGGATAWLNDDGTWTGTQADIRVFAGLERGKWIQAEKTIESNGHAADIETITIQLFEAIDLLSSVAGSDAAPLDRILWGAPRIFHEDAAGGREADVSTTKSTVDGDPESRTIEVDLYLGDGPVPDSTRTRMTWGGVDTGNWQEDDGSGAGITFRRMWGERRLEMSRLSIIGHKRRLWATGATPEIPLVHDALKVGSTYYDSRNYVWHLRDAIVEAEWLEIRKDSLSISHEDLDHEFDGEFPDGRSGPTPVVRDVYVEWDEITQASVVSGIATWHDWQNALSIRWSIVETNTEPSDWTTITDVDNRESGKRWGEFALSGLKSDTPYYLFVKPYNESDAGGDSGPTFRLALHTPKLPPAFSGPGGCLIAHPRAAMYDYRVTSGTNVPNLIRGLATSPGDEDGTIVGNDYTWDSEDGLILLDGTYIQLDEFVLGQDPALSSIQSFHLVRRDQAAETVVESVVMANGDYLRPGIDANGQAFLEAYDGSATDRVTVGSYIVPVGRYVVLGWHYSFVSGQMVAFVAASSGLHFGEQGVSTSLLSSSVDDWRLGYSGDQTLRFTHIMGDRAWSGGTLPLAEAVCLFDFGDGQGTGDDDGGIDGEPDELVIRTDEPALELRDFDGNLSLKITTPRSPGTHGCTPYYCPWYDLVFYESDSNDVWVTDRTGSFHAKVYESGSATKLINCIGMDAREQRVFISMSNVAADGEIDYGPFTRDVRQNFRLLGSEQTYWWLLDEATPSTLSDDGWNGTVLSDDGTTETQDSITGRRLSGAANDSLESTDAALKAIDNQWSFGVLVWAPGLEADGQRVLWGGGGSPYGVRLRLDPVSGGAFLDIEGASGNDSATFSGITFSSAAWESWSVVRDGSTAYLYQNVTEIGTLAITGGDQGGLGKFSLGLTSCDFLLARCAFIQDRAWSAADVSRFDALARSDFVFPKLVHESTYTGFGIIDFEIQDGRFIGVIESGGNRRLMQGTSGVPSAYGNLAFPAAMNDAVALKLQAGSQYGMWQESDADIQAAAHDNGTRVSEIRNTLIGSGYAVSGDKSLCVAGDWMFFNANQVAAGDIWRAMWNPGNPQDENSASTKLIATAGGTVRGMSVFDNQNSAPDAPVITATATGPNTINLSWTEPSGSLTYYVQRSLDDGVTWTDFASYSAGTSTDSDTGLTPETQYCYRIRAQALAGSSVWSAKSCDTTSALTGGDLVWAGASGIFLVSKADATNNTEVINAGAAQGAVAYSDTFDKFLYGNGGDVRRADGDGLNDTLVETDANLDGSITYAMCWDSINSRFLFARSGAAGGIYQVDPSDWSYSKISANINADWHKLVVSTFHGVLFAINDGVIRRLALADITDDGSNASTASNDYYGIAVRDTDGVLFALKSDGEIVKFANAKDLTSAETTVCTAASNFTASSGAAWLEYDVDNNELLGTVSGGDLLFIDADTTGATSEDGNRGALPVGAGSAAFLQTAAGLTEP